MESDHTYFVDASEVCVIVKEEGQQNSSDVQDDQVIPEVGSNSSFMKAEAEKWTHQSVMLLLDFRLEKEDLFNSPTCQKKKLWRLISEQMEKMGYSFSPESCDIKFRNLLQTYRVNVKKRNQNGEGAVKWDYFEKIDSVLGCKVSITPQTSTLTAFPVIQQPSHFLDVQPSGSGIHKPSRKYPRRTLLKRKRGDVLAEYINFKKRMDKLEIKQRAEEARKRDERFQQQMDMWKRELDLAEKLINYIIKKDQ